MTWLTWLTWLRLLFASHHHHRDLWLPQHCNIPLSTSVNPLSQRSLISLDWILTSGLTAHQSTASGVLTLPSGDTVCSMHMKLSVTPSLAYDLVLGRDWLFFCHETLPHASFNLSSGIVHPGQQPSGAHSHELPPSSILTSSAAAPPHTTSNSATEVDSPFSGNENVVNTPTRSKFICYSARHPILTFARS